MSDKEVLTFADARIAVDLAVPRVMRDGQETQLTAAMAKFLGLMASKAGQLVTHAEIGECIWNDPDIPAAKVAGFVSNVRYPLGPELGNSRKGAIRVVHGRGYKAVLSLTDEALSTDK